MILGWDGRTAGNPWFTGEVRHPSTGELGVTVEPGMIFRLPAGSVFVQFITA